MMRLDVVPMTAAMVIAMLSPRLGPAQVPGDSLVARVRVDSSRHTVVVTAGPWRRPSFDAAMMAMPGMHHAAAATSFIWPVDGWVRSLRFRARSADGRDVSRQALHHLALINCARRDLFYPIPERMLEMGGETSDIELPKSVAIPVVAGTPVVLTTAWANPGNDLLPDVTVELTIDWLPTGTLPQPLSVIPVTMQVTTAAGETSFDLPPGDHGLATLYPLSVAGRVVAAGGHLHDFGTAIVLRDLSTPGFISILSLATRHDNAGRVTAVERTTPGTAGPGIPLRAGHLYQLEGHYTNPTGVTIPGGGMAYLVLLVAPDRVVDWPAADPQTPAWRRFLVQIGLADSARARPGEAKAAQLEH